ncbi:MAG: hypothetical protein M1438_17660 [Deltaproteobacteria bacterium]|nr:hypothetical protein [Deltaproteobacteria bacterium]
MDSISFAKWQTGKDADPTPSKSVVNQIMEEATLKETKGWWDQIQSGDYSKKYKKDGRANIKEKD